MGVSGSGLSLRVPTCGKLNIREGVLNILRHCPCPFNWDDLFLAGTLGSLEKVPFGGYNIPNMRSHKDRL